MGCVDGKAAPLDEVIAAPSPVLHESGPTLLESRAKKEVVAKTAVQEVLPVSDLVSGGSEASNNRSASRRLPILIVPGFMSSGLRVERSTVEPSWEGERVWLSLGKLGIAAVHHKGLWDQTNAALAPKFGELEGEAQLHPDSGHLKNKWLEHLILKSADEEMDGIRVRAIPGVEGVDFLDPHLLVKTFTYVFGPVVSALQEAGYREGVDLGVATYDWRLAPAVLRQRDQFFDNMVEQVEKLNQTGSGVVLLGHSMGNKVVQYFLNYAKHKLGQAWLDCHVHTFLATGAPHVGAPAAARSTLLGDKMGLEAFITKEEALILGRSFSSSAWLLPLGPSANRTFFLRRQGALEIKDISVHVPGRSISKENRITVTFEIWWSDGEGKAALTSSSSERFTGKDASFDSSRNLLLFGGPAELPPDATLVAIVKEKGIHRKYRLDIAHHLADMARLSREAAMGRGGLGVPRAWSPEASLVELLAGRPDKDGFVDAQVRLKVNFGIRALRQRGGFVKFRARWRGFQWLQSDWLGSVQAVAELRARSATERPIRHGSRRAEYDRVDVPTMFKLEGAEKELQVWKKYYEGDSLYEHKGSDDAPPIKRVVAIHGVDVPTEVMFALKINTVRVKPGAAVTRFVLDDEAVLTPGQPSLKMSGGIVSEVPAAGSHSGDGTVPFASMEHCRQWQGQVESVRVIQLEKASHRGMLNDARFHRTLLEELDAMPVERAGGISHALSVP